MARNLCGLGARPSSPMENKEKQMLLLGSFFIVASSLFLCLLLSIWGDFDVWKLSPLFLKRTKVLSRPFARVKVRGWEA